MGKKTKSTANLGFEQQIWAAANSLRGSMDASEYKHVVLGLIFLKYISDKFEERYAQLEPDEVEDIDAYLEVNVFFVPENARWSVIANASRREEIGVVIDEAMRTIEKENKSLKDVLPKNYARSELDKRRLGEVVDLFTNIKLHEHGENKDLLGRTYEYCLGKFAAEEGKKGGEYYTPSCVVRTIVEILEPYQGRIYDPCCGSGGMFIQSTKFIESHAGNINHISIYGQESNPTTRKMALMNLAIRGIEADLGKYHADSFYQDLHPTLKADFILANPPFNVANWQDGSLSQDVRWRYGLPPSGNANYAWIQHMVHHLNTHGRMGIVLANGSLSSQTSGEGEIRKRLIEDDLIDGIIAMPTQLFYTTGIPVSIWLISRNKAQPGKTLFVDARNMGKMIDRKNRELDDEDIALIAKSFKAFHQGNLEPTLGFCAAVGIDEIAQQNYILTPGRYVGSQEQEETVDFELEMQRLSQELSSQLAASAKLEAKIRKELGALGYEV